MPGQLACGGPGWTCPPTGRPESLDHTSGVGWLLATVVLLVLAVVLLVLRRFRHLIIWLVVANLLAAIGGEFLSPVIQRPRPFGVVIREGWGGWAMPSLHVTFYALGLVTILYTLVPEGRWRNTGKWVVTALVALDARPGWPWAPTGRPTSWSGWP